MAAVLGREYRTAQLHLYCHHVRPNNDDIGTPDSYHHVRPNSDDVGTLDSCHHVRPNSDDIGTLDSCT